LENKKESEGDGSMRKRKDGSQKTAPRPFMDASGEERGGGIFIRRRTRSLPLEGTAMTGHNLTDIYSGPDKLSQLNDTTQKRHLGYHH